MIDRAERAVRTAAALAAAAVTVMALGGLARALRRPKGAGSGTGYRDIPLPVFVVAGSAYVLATVKAWRPLPLPIAPPVRWACLVAGAVLYVVGGGFVFGGRLALGDMYDLSTTRGADLYADHRLVTTGPFRLVRHPMYFGATLGTIGALLLYRTWTMLLICLHLPIYFVRARREEEALAKQFGSEWRAYRARVPAGVPGLR